MFVITLEVTGNGTIGQIIHDLVVVELFDVEYLKSVRNMRILDLQFTGMSKSFS